MADATILPTNSGSQYFYWPSCELRRPLTDDVADVTAYWSVTPKDEDGTQLTGGFVTGATNRDGVTEMMWVALGAVSVDGLSATVVRGIDIMGADYTVGSAAHTHALESGSPVFCAITPNIQNLVVQAIQGSVATGGNNFRVGDQAAGTKTYGIDIDGTFKGILRSDGATTEFSNDGTTWVTFASAIAGTLVEASSADTTPGYLEDKIDVATDGELTKTISSPGGNEQIQLGLATTMTKAEMDQLAGISANVTDTNLNTLTAGDSSNADALHTHTLSTVAVITAEAIDGSTTPQAISVLGNDFKSMILNPASGQPFYSINTGTQRNVGDVDTSTRRAQGITVTDAEATTIKLETWTWLLDKTGSPSDNIFCELQTDDGAGLPSGTVVTNGTSAVIAGAAVSANEQPVKFTWSTPPELTTGAQFHVVIKRSGANDGSNYFMVRDSNTNGYSGGTPATYTASLGTWVAATNDYQFVAVLSIDYDGKVMKTDSDDLRTANFAGFTKSNVASGATANLSSESFVGDFSSLDAGAVYYADATAGAIVTTPAFSTSLVGGQAMIRTGRALTVDTVEVDKKFYRVYEESSVLGSGQPFVATTGSMDIFLECGFRPELFEIRYTRFNVAGNTSDDRFVIKRCLNTTELEVSYFTNATGIFSTAQDNGITVQAVYENGALIRITNGSGTTETLNNLQIIVKG